MRSIVNSTLRACSSSARPAGVGCTPRRRAHQQRRAEVVLELRDALADRRRHDVLLLGGARHVPVVADRDEQAQGLQVEVAHGRDDARFVSFRYRNVRRSKLPLDRDRRECLKCAPSPAPDRRRRPETRHAPQLPLAASSIREVGLRDGLQSIRTDPADRAQAASGSATRTPPASARSRSARSCRRSCCRSSPTPPSCVAFAKTLPGLFVSVLVPNLKGAERAHRRPRPT